MAKIVPYNREKCTRAQREQYTGERNAGFDDGPNERTGFQLADLAPSELVVKLASMV
jgi:hypothetical protein